MKRAFQLQILLLFSIVSIILALITASAHRAFNRNIEDNAWVLHSYQILNVLDDFLSHVKEAEARQRYFIITGQSDSLTPFYEEMPQIKEDLAALKRLTQDNSYQQERCQSLQTLTESRLSFLNKTINLRQRLGFSEAQKRIMTGAGLQQSNDISRLHQDIKEEENRLLMIRTQKAKDSLQTAQLGNTLGTCAIFAVMCLVIYMIHYEMLRRQTAEESLQEIHLQDERRLEELESLRLELVRVNNLTELLQNCVSLEEAYDVISRTMPAIFPKDSGSIGMVNSSKNFVEVNVTWGNRPITTPIYSPESCWGLRRGRLHLSTDPSQDLTCPHISQALLGKEASPLTDEEMKTANYLCQPMMAHGDTLGVFQLVRFGFPWTERERILAVTLAELIAVALANLELQAALKVLSIQDPLTGLYNRRFMEAALEQELARALRNRLPVGVIMLDIDHFKRFNDTFGHDAGDALLAQIGLALQAFTRKEDIVCRYGGEEFLLILGQSSLEDTRQRADQLRLQAREIDLQYRGQHLGRVTLSLGVACYPEHGANPDSLIRAADAALYEAKRNGRDRVVTASITIKPEAELPPYSEL